MKTFNLILILLFSTSIVNAQFHYSPLRPKYEEYKPYKGFKKCEKYKLKDGKGSEKETIATVWEYNKNGQPLVELYYGESMDTFFKTSFVYDNNNRLIVTSEYVPILSKEETVTQFIYNEKGQLEKVKILSLDPTIITYFYDNNGFVKESHAYQKVPAYDEDGNESEPIEKEIYKGLFKTDKIGRITEISYVNFGSNDEYDNSIFYTYNKKGQISNYKNVGKDGKVQFEETYSFDKSGKVIAQITYNNYQNGNAKTTHFGFEYK
jgi:hypothetical protein